MVCIEVSQYYGIRRHHQMVQGRKVTSCAFALNCMMVKEFPSTACVGIDGGSCCGFARVGAELHELHTQSFNSSVLRCVLKTRTL